MIEPFLFNLFKFPIETANTVVVKKSAPHFDDYGTSTESTTDVSTQKVSKRAKFIKPIKYYYTFILDESNGYLGGDVERIQCSFSDRCDLFGNNLLL